MSKSNQAMCPLFPDVPCPQGTESAESCQVRLDNDFNPLSNHNDYLFLNCALQRAEEAKQNVKHSNKNNDEISTT